MIFWLCFIGRRGEKCKSPWYDFVITKCYRCVFTFLLCVHGRDVVYVSCFGVKRTESPCSIKLIQLNKFFIKSEIRVLLFSEEIFNSKLFLVFWWTIFFKSLYQPKEYLGVLLKNFQTWLWNFDKVKHSLWNLGIFTRKITSNEPGHDFGILNVDKIESEVKLSR